MCIIPCFIRGLFCPDYLILFTIIPSRLLLGTVLICIDVPISMLQTPVHNSFVYLRAEGPAIYAMEFNTHIGNSNSHTISEGFGISR